MQAIFQAAPVGLLLFNDELVIRSANEYAANMIGQSAPEVVGQPLGPAIRPAARIVLRRWQAADPWATADPPSRPR